MAKRNSKTAAQQCRYYEVDNIFLLRTMAWQTLLEKNGVINGILLHGAFSWD